MLFLFTLSALPSYARQARIRMSGSASRRRAFRRAGRRRARRGRALGASQAGRERSGGIKARRFRAPRGQNVVRSDASSERCDVEESRTDFEPGFEREPVFHDQDETRAKSRRALRLRAYLGCLARHLRRFASRRGATAARGVGTAPSSIAGAFSAALETARARDGKRAREHRRQRVRGRRRRARRRREPSPRARLARRRRAGWGRFRDARCTRTRRRYVLDNASTRWEE